MKQKSAFLLAFLQLKNYVAPVEDDDDRLGKPKSKKNIVLKDDKKKVYQALSVLNENDDVDVDNHMIDYDEFEK